MVLTVIGTQKELYRTAAWVPATGGGDSAERRQIMARV
jgi:hypothetical protein